MNRKRLQELKKLLKTADTKHFDMRHWLHDPCKRVNSIEDLHNDKIATACAAGYAALHKPFNDQGLSLRRDSGASPIMFLDGVRYDNYEAVEAFFDLNWQDTRSIFSATFYENKSIITPDDVIKKIDLLLSRKEGKPNLFSMIRNLFKREE